MMPFLNHWWNLPFLVMLGLVIAFFVMQMIGLAGHGDGDHEAESDAEADADADHDHEAEHDADDADGDHGGGGVKAFLGVGRVPFMVIWTTLFAFGGLAGLCFNYALFTRAAGDYRAWHFAVASAGALAVGAIAVRLFSRVAARLVDVGGKGSVAKHELVGKAGVVASAELDKRFGEVRVRDGRGNEILIHGCLRDDEPSLKREAKVVLVDYDEARGLFWVTAYPELDGSAKEPVSQAVAAAAVTKQETAGEG